MHESVIGVAIGLIVIGLGVAMFLPFTRAAERCAVRKAYGLPRRAPLVRVDGVLFPADTQR